MELKPVITSTCEVDTGGSEASGWAELFSKMLSQRTIENHLYHHQQRKLLLILFFTNLAIII